MIHQCIHNICAQKSNVIDQSYINYTVEPKRRNLTCIELKVFCSYRLQLHIHIVILVSSLISTDLSDAYDRSKQLIMLQLIILHNFIISDANFINQYQINGLQQSIPNVIIMIATLESKLRVLMLLLLSVYPR